MVRPVGPLGRRGGVKAPAVGFPERAEDLRASIEAALGRYLSGLDGCPVRLAEAMRYSLLAPGKRLRPVLVLLAAEACGGSVEAAMPAACAVEMVHAYSLVHDDLPAMDDDDFRRGQPTCHKRFDEATAILAGDALLALAFEILAREVQPAETAAKCCACLAEAAGPRNLVGGQADDLQGAAEGADLGRLESIHRRKTGALIEACLRLGALVAGADAGRLSALHRYGQALGLAFQITDDLLDVQGDAQAVGKRLGKDSAQGKLTFPGLVGIDSSRRRAEHLASEACQALEGFGAGAEPLRRLARYVVERTR